MNPYIEISLTKGVSTKVDLDDYPLILDYTWRAQQGRRGLLWYATTSKNKKTVFMHKLITGYTMTDHKNGDGLDNRRINLREATPQQNKWNQRKRSGSISKYKGVGWQYTHNKWVARIVVDSKRKFIGYFDSEIDAALAYDSVCREKFGEFGTLNFPNVGERSALL